MNARELFWNIVEGLPDERRDVDYWPKKERRFLEALRGLFSTSSFPEADALKRQILLDTDRYFGYTRHSEGDEGPVGWSFKSKLKFIAELGIKPEFWERILDDSKWWDRHPSELYLGVNRKGEPTYG